MRSTCVAPQPKRADLATIVIGGHPGVWSVRQSILGAVTPAEDGFLQAAAPDGRRLLHAALEASLAGDWLALRGMCNGLTAEASDALAAVLGERLAAAGMGAAWARIWQVIPTTPNRAFGDELTRRLAPAPNTAPRGSGQRREDTPRRQLGRLAVRLIRNGAGSRELLCRLDAANAALPVPLASADIGNLAVWAARTVRSEVPHAAV